VLRSSLILVAVVLLGPACTTEPWTRSLGIIDPGVFPKSFLFVVPETVAVGAPVPVRFATWGSSTCTQPDRTVVEVVGLMADITPYDRYAPDGTPCLRDLTGFPRKLTLTFSQPGRATVRLHGLSLTDGPATLTDTLTVGL